MTTHGIRIAVVGVGKIARDQHLPAIANDPGFTLVATVDRAGAAADVGVPWFATLEALLSEGPPIDAIAVCTPPAVRMPIVVAALTRGLQVMTEKPPATTLADVATMRAAAEAAGRTLFAAWHSREANGVAPARDWIAGKRVDRVAITWREDIRRWHPGQDWILGESGFGVFDPGINALSILTTILPDPVALTTARIAVPRGRRSPIAATLALRSGATPISATFDFLQTGPQTWDIAVETEAGRIELREGGSVFAADGGIRRASDEEYPRLYRRFADLIARGESDVDDAALRLVIDALETGERVTAAPFDW